MRARTSGQDYEHPRHPRVSKSKLSILKHIRATACAEKVLEGVNVPFYWVEDERGDES